MYSLETCLFSKCQKVLHRCVGLQLWWPYSQMLMEWYWLSWARQHYHRNLPHWSDQKSSGSIEGEEMTKVVSESTVSPGQRTCSHIIWGTGCHPKCWIRTTSPPIIFARLAPSDQFLFPKLEEFMKGSKFADDEEVISMANGWLRAWSTILQQWNPSFGETLDQVLFSCRRLC